MSDVNKLDYKFKLVGVTEFEYGFAIKGVKNKMLKLLFDKSRDKMKNEGINNKVEDFDPEKLKGTIVDIPKMYFNTLRTSLNSNFKELVRIVGRDGIKILRFKIEKAFFINTDEGWNFHIEGKGDYDDNR